METFDRWHEIDDLFAAALGRAPEQRAAFLEHACDDRAQRCAVEALLAAASKSTFLEAPLEERSGAFWQAFAAEVAQQPPAPSLAGRTVGPYRLVRLIGCGGMGAVYLGERADEQFAQRVAVKVLRRDFGADGADDIVRHFLSERQILASLNHPNIAHLYDGGMMEPGPAQAGDDRPYFVMEYVEGSSIVTFCDEKQLSVKERLRLFLTICDAVQHAHRRLVVHRDLKPSNILATEEGEVKLLDFGIAKLLGSEAVDLPHAAAVQTHTGLRLMTPAYASPEQVRGDPITTASDVYQLGLVLYELLAGQQPYRVEGRTPSDVERIVCKEEPLRPSAAIVRRENAAARVSRARATSPSRLRRRLTGDLDTIVLKALRKEPERRYASAEALAEDLERHLEGCPVQARPDTLGYRAKKFVQRHWIGVAAAALVLVSLLGGLAGTVWQARRAAEQARRATAERDKAEQVTAFLVDVFEVADPSEARGDTVTARELLRRGAARIRGELKGQPEVQAAMLHALGRVYRQLGLYDEARPLLEDALALRQERFDGPHSDVAESLRALGVLLHQQNEYDRAEALLQEALTMRRALFDAPHPAIATSLYRLGLVTSDRQDHDRAERVLRAALAMGRTLYGDAHRLVADSRFDLAMVLHDQGKYQEAYALLEKAVDGFRNLPGEVTPAYGASLHTLAVFADTKRDYAIADSLHQEALDVRRVLYGPKHPKVAESLRGLGAVRRKQGDLAGAEQLIREALSIQRAWSSDDQPALALNLASLGRILKDKGQSDAAEVSMREALAVQRRLYSNAHPYVATGLNALADLLRDRGDLDRAEPLYEEALAICNKAYGEDNLLALRIRIDRAVLRRKRGSYEQAVPTLREALAKYRKLFQSGHVRLAGVRRELGICLAALGRYEEAEQHLLAAYALFRNDDQYEDSEHITLEHLVKLYEAWGKPDRAATYRPLLADAPNS